MAGVPILDWGGGIADGKVDGLVRPVRIFLKWYGRYDFLHEIPKWIFDFFESMVAIDLFFPSVFVLHDSNYIKIPTDMYQIELSIICILAQTTAL